MASEKGVAHERHHRQIIELCCVADESIDRCQNCVLHSQRRALAIVPSRIQKRAGMRWTVEGAQAMLDLRAVRINGDWDTYWQLHRQQQHQRLYGAATVGASPEAQALQMAA